MGIGSILVLFVVLIVSVVFPIVAPNFGATPDFLKQYANYSNLIIPLIAFTMCAITSSKYDNKDDTRKAWLFVAFGALIFSLGQLVFMIYGVIDPAADAPPFPGWHDVLFLLSPLLMAIGLWHLRKSLRGTMSSVGAFLTIFVGLAAIVFAFFVQWSTLTNPDSSTLAIVTTIMYTLLDPIMLGFSVLAISMMVGGLVSRPWWVIIFGLIIIYAGDVYYNILNMQNAYAPGHFVDITWPLAYGLIIVAAIWNQEILG